MGTLCYGVIVKFEDMKELLYKIYEDEEPPEIFLDLQDLVPGDGSWSSSLCRYGYEGNFTGKLQNGHDVASFFTDMKVDGISFVVCGKCCHEDVGDFLVGWRGGSISGRGDSCNKIVMITPSEKQKVLDFCTKNGLSDPGFFLNSEECYECGH